MNLGTAVSAIDLQVILNAIPGNHVILLPNSPTYTIIGATDAFLQVSYRTREQLIGKPLFEVFPDNATNEKATGVSNLRASLDQVVEHKKAHQMANQRYDIINPTTGAFEFKVWSASNKPVLDADGAIQCIIHTTEDITETVRLQEAEQVARQKTAESKAALQQSEQNFRAMILQAPVAICIFRGPEYILEVVNPLMEVILGRKAASIQGKPFFEAMPEVRGQGLEQVLDGIMNGGTSFISQEQEFHLPRAGGVETRYVTYIYEPLRNVDGTVSGVMVVATDVTEQVTSRKKIEESEARSRAAIEIARLGTFEIDVEQQSIIHSPRNAEILGLDPTKQWPYQRIVETVHPEDRAIRLMAIEEAKRTGVLFYEARIIQPDQSIRWVRLNGRYIQQETHPKIIGTLMDITEEKKVAEVLEQKVEERTRELKLVNEQLKQFTYAASHDLQEPLRKISFFLDRLLSNIGPSLNEDNQRTAERIQHTALRMRSLIDDLLAYSNTSLGVTGFEKVDLNVTVQGVLDDMEATIIQKRAVVDVQNLPIVHGDGRQLRQLFQNIISNGLKYNKKGEPPQLTITFNRIQGGATEAYLPKERRDEEFYLIEIKDNGIGFDPDDAERIFRLFQRLHGKAEYEGTGVGLAIVQQVADNHKGFVWAGSRPGEGATFKVLLPVEQT